MGQPAVGSLGEALRDVSRLINQARATKRTLRRLQDHLNGGLLLGVFTLTPDQDLGEVIDLLRLAMTDQQEVAISVTALRGTDQGEEP